MSRQSIRRKAAPLALTVVVAGCALGPRPELRPSAAGVGDPSADAVLALLGDAATVPFHATYEVTAAGGPTATAVVDQRGGQDRTVTIGDVRYETSGGSSQTCDEATGACEPGIDPARVSDLAVTADFFAASAAARLRADASRRIGPTTADSASIADAPATCVTVPIQVTNAHYCALDAGPLASMRTTDVTVELVDFTAG